MLKKGLFQTIQFKISTLFSFIWPIDSTLSGATTKSQSGLGRDGNEGVIRIPQHFSLNGYNTKYLMVFTLRFLVLYPGQWLEGSYVSLEK